MTTNSLPIFSLFSQRMNWLSARQAVLSENVANADTPNYEARDLKAMDFGRILASHGGGQMVATNRMHIGRPQASGVPIEPVTAPSEGGIAGGSEVSMEEEMIKLADTQLQYQTATNLYQKAVNMFRTALGGR